MTKKRKHPDSSHAHPHSNENAIFSKRSRPNNDGNGDDHAPSAQSKVDPTYGQRGAFPGLDDGPSGNGEDDLFYGPANDGFEYLRMVRSEAKTVPNLLVAPPSPSSSNPKREGNLYEDYPQGYYHDGAYTALPSSTDFNPAHPEPGEEDTDLDPQEAYYTSLLSRFTHLSQTLQSPPPPSLTTPPTHAHPHRSLSSDTRWKHWRRAILTTTPTMQQLSTLSQEAVIRALEVLEDLLSVENLQGGKGRCVGAWAWGLLGRCRDVGCMGSDEVGVLRRVGKKAVWVLRRIMAGEGMERSARAGGEQEDGREEGDGEDGDGGEEGDVGEEGDENAGQEVVDEVENMGATYEEGQSEEDEEILSNPAPEEAADIDVISPIAPKTAPSNESPRLPSKTPANKAPEDPPPEIEESEAALAAARERVLSSLQNTDEVQEPSSPNKDRGKDQQSPSKPMEKDQEDGGIDAVYATLDMIVTIVGECYGQRDLLDGRVLWDEMG